MEPSDAELIEAVLAGDRARFQILIERHGRALLAFLARRVGDREELREMYQDTWVRAYEGLARLRAREGLRGWVLGIGANVLGKSLRRARPRPLDEEAGERAAREEPAAAGLERAELRARLARELALLPGRQREVFELRALRELPYEQIADRLAIREDAARASFYQAVRKLRAALEDQMP